MSKLKAPLLSFSASGTLGRALTFQETPAGARVISTPDHVDTHTPRQITQRLVFLEAIAHWASLSDAAQAVYRAEASRYHITGYNLCLRRFLKGQIQGACRLLLPMLEGNGALCSDYSGYGNDGTIFGATWGVQPSGLTLLSFDGLDDYVGCGTHSSLSVATAITLELVISWRSLRRGHIFAKYNFAGGNQRSYILVWIPGTLRFSLSLNGIGHTDLDYVFTPTLNRAYHIVASWDGTDMLIAINGVPVATRPFAGPIFSSTSILAIGGSQNYNQWLDGYCLVARLLNYALAPHHISLRYAAIKRLFPSLSLP